MMQRMLTAKDIKENLGVSLPTVYKLLNMKSFPKIKIGKRFYIPEESYNTWIKENVKNTILL